MPKDLPKKINDAIDILWKYSTDACISGRTKEECEAEGYECKGENVYYVTFVMERKGVLTKHECNNCKLLGKSALICLESSLGSDCDNFDKG